MYIAHPNQQTAVKLISKSEISKGE